MLFIISLTNVNSGSASFPGNVGAKRAFSRAWSVYCSVHFRASRGRGCIWVGVVNCVGREQSGKFAKWPGIKVARPMHYRRQQVPYSMLKDGLRKLNSSATTRESNCQLSVDTAPAPAPAREGGPA